MASLDRDAEPGAVVAAEPAPRPPVAATPLSMLQQFAGNRAVASLFGAAGGGTEPAPPIVIAPAAAAPVSLDDERFNAGSRAHDLIRAIDSTEHDYRTKGGSLWAPEDAEAERRKVDFSAAVEALKDLTESQVRKVEAEFLAFDKIELRTALFGGGTSGRKAGLTDDQRARLEVLMRGTKAEPFPPAEMERLRAYPPDIAARLIAARERGPQLNQIEAEAIELHELLGKDLNEDRRERVMALHRRHVTEIDAIDAVYARKYGEAAMARDLNLRLKGLQLSRIGHLRIGNTAQADALAIEDKRRQIEKLNNEDAEAQQMPFGYGASVGGYQLIMKQQREEQRRKLTGDITAIIELNKAEALADKNNAGRAPGEVVAERVGAILDQQHGDPGNTVGAELAKTLGKEDAAAIRALGDRWNVVGSANLIEAAAGRLAADEKAGKTKASAIIETMRSFKELARHDLTAEAFNPAIPPERKQELLAGGEAAVTRLGQQYIERYRQAYDRLAAGGRSFDKIVASADDADETLIGELAAHGEASDLAELRHAMGKKDVAKVKDVLKRQKDGAAVKSLIAGYNGLGEGHDLERELFGKTVEGATASAEQAQSNEFMAALGGLVRARDAAQVGELLTRPSDAGEQATWITKGGINEYDVTMAHRGLTGDMREWGDVPETQQLLKRTRDDLEKMNERVATITDPAERERLLREMRRLRATLTGDADAYEKDNARVLAEIQSALSFAVSIALAVAIPGAGPGIAAFLQTTAINIAATVASNFVIKMGDYSLADLKADVLGGALGAGGAKFGEELMGRVASAVLKPTAEATASAAGRAGVSSALSREVGALAGASERVVIEAAEFEVKAAAGGAGRAFAVAGAREVGGFAGGLYAPKVLTGDYGLTMEEVLKALAGTLAGKAAGKYREHADAKKQASGEEQPAQRSPDEEAPARKPEEDGALPAEGGAAPAASFHPEPVPANADVFGPRSPKQMLLDNGIPPASAEGFQQVADALNVVIKVRPTNTASLDVLAAGGLPKPEIIKAKTVNRADLLIGGPPDGLGKVGFFEPAMPSKDVLDVLLPAERQAIDARYAERLAEFQKYREEYSGLAAEGMLKLEGGVIKIADPRTAATPDAPMGQFKDIGGDHDLFQITGPDGQPLNDHVRRGVINQLRSMGINVEHGDHSSWAADSPGTYDAKADAGIRGRHETSEPLVAFVPKSQPREVMAGDAVNGPERVEGPGDRHLSAVEGTALDQMPDRSGSPMITNNGRGRTSQAEAVDMAAHQVAPEMARIREVWEGMSPHKRAEMLIRAVHLQMLERTGVRLPSVKAVDKGNSHFDPTDWHVDLGHPALHKDAPTIAEFAEACEHARHEMEHVLIEFRVIRLEAQGIKRNAAGDIEQRWGVKREAVEAAVRANRDPSVEPLSRADQQVADFRELLHGAGADDYRRVVQEMQAADAALTAAKEAVKVQESPEAKATLDKAQAIYDEANEAYLALPDEMVAWPAGEQVLKAVEQYLDLNARMARARDDLVRLKPILDAAISQKATAEVIKQLTQAQRNAEALIEFATKRFKERGQAVP